MHHLLTYLYHGLFASHLVAASAYALQELNQNNSNNTSIIATTILSTNNTDLTPSFQTLIYYNPPQSNISNNHLNLSTRQASSRRPIDFCKSPSASFLTSYCRYSHGHYSPLQNYEVFCQEDTQERHQQPSTTSSAAAPSASVALHHLPHYHHLLPQMVTEDGACHQDEICVDGELGEGMAYCVSKSEFGLLNQLKEEPDVEDVGENERSPSSRKGRRKKGGGDGGWIKVERKGGLRGKVATMVISGDEGIMPTELGGINLKAGAWGKEAVVRQERKCEACFELRTERMGDETDFLETQAKLMLGGTVATAAAGVVWLIVSG